MALSFGIATPIVTLLPARADSWEATGGPEEIRRIAVKGDELGYAHMTCSEHVGIPSEITARRGGRYYDPLPTFGYCAAFTERIRFATNVLVVPYHHPLAIAKRYGTLDLITGGRVILGLGVGSLQEEFELLDAEFARRGELYSDALNAIRAAWGERQPTYAGEHYPFDDFIIDPTAATTNAILWLGGRSLRSLRRAVEDADGWMPFGLGLDELRTMIERARQLDAWERRRQPFEIVLGVQRRFEPDSPGGADQMAEHVEQLQKLGATTINVSFPSKSIDHHLELLEAFWTDVVPRFS